MKKAKVAKVATSDTRAAQAPVPVMKDQVVEILKQNVQKWEEAAIAVGQWMPKVAESDRVSLAERGRQYTRNARELRDFIEQLAVEECRLLPCRP